jgi:2-polyprenyl-6-methoxyphenol hydroxylase-like FAD-dependent oxidoreductase
LNGGATVAGDGKKRALVIGGSVSGLFAALLLRQAGWEVEVFERSETELTGRGAGIVTHVELIDAITAVGLDAVSNLGVEVAGRKTLDRAGRVIGEYPCPQTVTSWDRVFRMLRQALPANCYHLGKELMRVDEKAGHVVAHFTDGTREGELLVGADGFRSTVRAQIFPEARPGYAGYVAWRGLVAERALTEQTRADIFDAMVFCLPPGEQMLGYPVAGADDDLRVGHRRYNFVWYRPTDEERELKRLLTDQSGRTHALSIPPPLIREDVIRELRQATEELLAPQLQEVVRLAPEPFLQPIYDGETPRMASRRIALIGDAAFLARPHVGAGVTKAAQDALSLVGALRSERDVEAALAAFERARGDENRRIIERGRELGAYLESKPKTKSERRAAEQHRTPQAVMAEIALLDFLRGRKERGSC